MKIIDKNGRLFQKISIIDIIIVLAVLFLIFSIIFSKTQSSSGASTIIKQETAYTVQIKAYGIYNTERSPFSLGDNIYGNDGEIIGEVIAVDKKPTIIKFKLNDGSYVNRDSAEYVDYFLTVKGRGSETEKGIFASGTLPLIPSNNIIISSKNFNGNSIVLSVEK